MPMPIGGGKGRGSSMQIRKHWVECELLTKHFKNAWQAL